MSYARVICYEHGAQELTQEEYSQQLSNPYSRWRCPCGAEAMFDDEYFEAQHMPPDDQRDPVVDDVSDLL